MYKQPFIIGIGGTYSGSGKTSLAVAILKHFKGCGVHNKWGALKYTKTALYSSIVDDRITLAQKDKDTGRFLDAGADAVIWVRAPYKELSDVLPLALDRLSGLDGVVVEGNSAIEFLKPDIVIFILGNDKKRWKPEIERGLVNADVVLYENASELPEIAKSKRLFQKTPCNMEDDREFFELLSGLLNERKTEERAD